MIIEKLKQVLYTFDKMKINLLVETNWNGNLQTH